MTFLSIPSPSARSCPFNDSQYFYSEKKIEYSYDASIICLYKFRDIYLYTLYMYDIRGIMFDCIHIRMCIECIDIHLSLHPSIHPSIHTHTHTHTHTLTTQVQHLIRGPVGTEVWLTILRALLTGELQVCFGEREGRESQDGEREGRESQEGSFCIA